MTLKQLDNREFVEVRFSDEELLRYMIMAHELDITFNEFVEVALRQAIAEREQKEQNDESCS